MPSFVIAGVVGVTWPLALPLLFALTEGRRMKSGGRFYCMGVITCYVSLFAARLICAAIIGILLTVWFVESDCPVVAAYRFAVDGVWRCPGVSMWVTTGLGMLLSIVPQSLILKRFLANQSDGSSSPDRCPSDRSASPDTATYNWPDD